ncbi:MAG: Gldg family protein [Leptospiraceae bacterium]|nr:Gldg family protein [Leptospiraceae bacterium]MCP5498855.1 Gldg family protein [Leptospiraceae bacterium]
MRFIYPFLHYLPLLSLFVYFLVYDYLETKFYKTIWGIVCISSFFTQLLYKTTENKRAKLFLSGLGFISFFLFILYDYYEVPPRSGLSEELSALSAVRTFILALLTLSTFLFIIFSILLDFALRSVHAQTFQDRDKRSVFIQTFSGFLIILPLLFALNYIAVQRNFHFDPSSQKKHSLSPYGLSVLKKLEVNLKITAFYPRPLESSSSADEKQAFALGAIRPEIQILLEQIRSANPSRIQFEFINAEVETNKLHNYDKISNGMIHIRAIKNEPILDTTLFAEKTLIVSRKEQLDSLEKNLIQAILSVSQEKKKIYFTSDNSERFSIIYSAIPDESIQTLIDNIRYVNYTVENLGVSNSWPEKIPEDADTIAIIGPVQKFSENHRKAIWKYFSEKKGNLFISLDPKGEETFDWILEKANLEFKPSSLMQFSGKPAYIRTNAFGSHPINEDIPTGATILFPSSGYFEPIKRNGNLEYTILLKSPIETFLDKNQNLAFDPKTEEKGSKLLGVLLKGKDTGSMIIYSGTSWLTDRFYPKTKNPLDISVITNSHFVLNNFLWLNGGILSSEIPIRSSKILPVSLKEYQKTFIWIVSLFIFPAFVMLISSSYLIYKKRLSERSDV